MVKVILTGYNVEKESIDRLISENRDMREILGKVRKLEDADTAEIALNPDVISENLNRLGESAGEFLKEHPEDYDNITPEVIAAAYARISRDPRSIPELRAESRSEVKSARKSSAAIIFKMGHASIGNHVMFNFDVLGLSRLAVEALEERRIGTGFTEKSQRYITLEGDYVVPAELSPEDAELFRDLVENVQNRFYLDNIERMIAHQFEKHPDIAAVAREKQEKGIADKDNTEFNMLAGWGKEDMRYSLGLSAEAQIGTSFSATALEKAIRYMKYSELAEVRELAGKLMVASGIAPSLFWYSDPERFEKKFKRPLEDGMYRDSKKERVDAVEALCRELAYKTKAEPVNTYLKQDDDVTIIRPEDIDTGVLIALIHGNSMLDIKASARLAETLKESPAEAEAFIKKCLHSLTLYDDPSREFEFGSGLMFEIEGSSSFYAQMKRHRGSSWIAQDYSPSLGITVPESIAEAGLEAGLREVASKSEELYERFEKSYGSAIANYCLTNAHKRRVLAGFNPRQFHHFVALREDSHAQWDIRGKASRMNTLAKEYAPLSLLLTHGKSLFDQKRAEIYGTAEDGKK